MYGWSPKKQRSLLHHLFKILYPLFFSSLVLNAQNSNLNHENRFYKDKNHHPKGFGMHTDIGYSSYLIELDSSEINSVIDYNILELTLGFSYRYNNWMWGFYGKFLLDELESNMYLTTTQKRLDNNVKIEKNEFALYTNYSLAQYKQSQWSLNVIYRYSVLNAIDNYHSFNNYSSKFNYQTNGLALSLLYAQNLTDNSSYFINTGFLYSRAKVKVSEHINQNAQDSFVDTSTSAIGTKLNIGYNHQLSNSLFLNIRMDGWRLNFGKLPVSSHIGDSLPKAKLKEESYSTYGGITWRF